MTKTRGEHIAWCKQRAHQEYNYYKTKEPGAAIRNAVVSMLSDLGKHPETEGSLSWASMLGLSVRDEGALLKFIDGFN